MNDVGNAGDNPLVSVIVAVRNGERYLDVAIQSILAQEYGPLEILLVDGKSTDRTATIAKSYPQVRYMTQTGDGIAAAYNQGVTAAAGELVAFLSHDDIWTANKLRTQVACMLECPSLLYTVAHAKFFLETPGTLPHGFRSELLQGDHVAYIMETLLVRKEAFEKIGLFETTLSTGEDVDWFARARDKHILHRVIPQVLLRKRVHSTNASLNDPSTNQVLLKVLRRSIVRKRTMRDECGT